MKHRAAIVHERRHEWKSGTRRSWVILWLWQGSRLSSKDIAKLFYMSERGARKMMSDLAADFPIDIIDGKWQWLRKDE